ncbi:MAG TPA: Xaa-Pro aminopeptidase [Verrucomicrobium sp.]|nr:Xaa-Pro aminopeptidase [Verrucomicrobium sp.]
MRHTPIDRQLFIENRERLCAQLEPRSLAVVNNNDVLPTNADGSLMIHPGSDLFYLTGVEQEESVLLLFPQAHDARNREVLFLREPTAHVETWEGVKLNKEDAHQISGIARVEWLGALPGVFHALMCEAENVYLNSNEHPRAQVVVQTRESRFVEDTLRQYPLHRYHRLARLLHELRTVKSRAEIALIRKACGITRDGLKRVARFLKPGVTENQVEAEFAHEFISQGAKFAYTPIIASGANALGLHYIQNSSVCQEGDLLLLDVGSSYANYNSDMTRTLPVSGRFTKRQRQVYDAVLRAYKVCLAALKPGLLAKDWRVIAQDAVQKELVDLKLLSMKQVREQGPERKALAEYFMHGVGHPIGLDVHDVQPVDAPLQAGWVMTCEPAIYIKKEGFGIRLEDTVEITEKGPVSLMQDIPMEADEIESLMASKSTRGGKRK